jgi:peptide-methionine (R)-S-oxide reductase
VGSPCLRGSPEVGADYIDQLIGPLLALDIARVRVRNVGAQVILDHLRHQSIHGTARRSDLLQNFRASLLRLQGALEALDLAANAAHATQEFGLLTNGVTHTLINTIGEYSIVRPNRRNKTGLSRGVFPLCAKPAASTGSLSPGRSVAWLQAQPACDSLALQCSHTRPKSGIDVQRNPMSQFDLRPPSEAQRAQITAGLSADERRVLLEHGTEAAFCGVFLDNHQDGTYTCRFCGLPLFRSSAKFDSGTGWPSFFKPYDETHIRRVRDTSYGMVRVEEVCARCGSHLGHVFPDGPAPSGERHCLNSVSLSFTPQAQALPDILKRGAPEGQVGRV